MAGEMGGDAAMCRIAGLLHDIGKAIDHEVEGPHAMIGAERAKRYGISKPVVNAIAAHHFDEDPETFEAFAIAAADAISAARPGARRETVDLFIKRMQTLEDIANSFEGVEKSYAIQAGREVRIAVRPDDIDELGTLRLSRNISKKIQDTMAFPGQIKVTVIRETRSVGYAR
jgi:ribonuclease Y